MIAKLCGIVDSFAEGYIILMTSGGVGYRVFCSLKTIAKMTVGQNVALFIETQVREDHIHLIGFADKAEQDMFALLVGVQGVGTKVALNMLSVLTPTEIHTALMTSDDKALTRAPGIGKKVALRLITELKSKTGTLDINMNTLAGTTNTGAESPALLQALSALENLGYNRSEAGIVLKNIIQTQPDLSVSALIKTALKELAAHV